MTFRNLRGEPRLYCQAVLSFVGTVTCAVLISLTHGALLLVVVAALAYGAVLGGAVRSNRTARAAAIESNAWERRYERAHDKAQSLGRENGELRSRARKAERNLIAATEEKVRLQAQLDRGDAARDVPSQDMPRVTEVCPQDLVVPPSPAMQPAPLPPHHGDALHVQD